MTLRDDTTGDLLTSVWRVEEEHVHVDEDCSPSKVCRNMRDVTFDGFGDPDSDPADSWRDLLAREGKLDGSAGSLRDLVLGEGEPS
jgi:hypothetical protein